jgi:hypothetical protein
LQRRQHRQNLAGVDWHLPIDAERALKVSFLSKASQKHSPKQPSLKNIPRDFSKQLLLCMLTDLNA